jgi:23S rRNA pseudouridine1911/1915/1917 synthase
MELKRTYLFCVENRAGGVRLDQLISQLIPELSRSKAQKLISGGHVTVNERPALKRYLARGRDLLRVTLPEPERSAFHPEDIPLRALYEDADLLAVDKPAGMVVHPAPGHPRGTLVNALLHMTSSLSQAGGSGRPGIVHRLDKDTSGVVLVAKNDACHRKLAAQFARRTVDKTYLAVAFGSFPRSEGLWDTSIGRDRKERKKISSRSSRPRSAVTRYRVLENLEGASLLELHPETGRTHQIRVHLAESRHPVLGDPIYGPKPRRGSVYHALGKRFGFDTRLALHAWKIRCRHPSTKETLSLESPLPEPFLRIMQR